MSTGTYSSIIIDIIEPELINPLGQLSDYDITSDFESKILLIRLREPYHIASQTF
jgi:hypothetical protein